MARAAWFLAVGGCLLGWEPEGVDDTGDDPALPLDETGSEPPDGTCGVYDGRTITISAGLTPEISSDEGISDLYVYLGLELQWHAWSTDYENSVFGFTYGETPAGTTEGLAAIPLTAGVEYEVQIDALCTNAAGDTAVSSVWKAFTAGP